MVYLTIAFTLRSLIRMQQDVSAAPELTLSTDQASQMKYGLWIHLTCPSAKQSTENAWKGKTVTRFCDNSMQFG